MSDKLLAMLKAAKKVTFRTMYLSYIDRSGQPLAFGEFTKTDLAAHVSMVEELLSEHEKLMGFLQAGSAERDKDLTQIAVLIKENAALKSKLLQEKTGE